MTCDEAMEILRTTRPWAQASPAGPTRYVVVYRLSPHAPPQTQRFLRQRHAWYFLASLREEGIRDAYLVFPYPALLSKKHLFVGREDLRRSPDGNPG